MASVDSPTDALDAPHHAQDPRPARLDLPEGPAENRPTTSRRTTLTGSSAPEMQMVTARPSRSTPLRVGLAGAGMISWYHLTAWRNVGPRARVVAVADPDPARARARADEFGIPGVYADADSMLGKEELDALDVASPRETHAAWVEAAAARGVDILCQKPLTPTLAEAEALVARVGTRVRLMIHENWRFRPWYRELKKWISDGLLGE